MVKQRQEERHLFALQMLENEQQINEISKNHQITGQTQQINDPIEIDRLLSELYSKESEIKFLKATLAKNESVKKELIEQLQAATDKIQIFQSNVNQNRQKAVFIAERSELHKREALQNQINQLQHELIEVLKAKPFPLSKPIKKIPHAKNLKKQSNIQGKMKELIQNARLENKPKNLI